MDVFSLNLIMIVCFVVGSGLIIAEAFLPGFGVAGISGVVLEIIGIWSCWKQHGTGTALLALAGVLLLIGLVVFASYRSAMNGRLSRSHLVLKNEESVGEKDGSEQWIGQEGTVVTALKPAGFIEVAGKRLSAASGGEFIEKGASVIIAGAEGDHFVIRRKN